MTLRVLSLGWGVQSFTLAAMSALGELPPVDYAIHADTTWERQHTYAFAAIWRAWLEEYDMASITVNAVGKHNDPRTIGQTNVVCVPGYTRGRRKDGQIRRQCTYDWKVMPIHRYLRSLGVKRTNPAELWIGISKDEWHRAKDSDVKYIAHRWPLLELDMTRADCVEWLQRHGLEVPGKSACTFCPYRDKRAWQDMKRENGADWAQAVEVDAAIRDKRPPYPLFVHSACKPLPQAVIIPEDTGYTQLDLGGMDDADAECDSGYCFL